MKIVSSLLMGAVESTSLSFLEQNFLIKKKPAGITLFSRNISSEFDASKQLDLITQIQKLTSNDMPFLIAVDQEGGRVKRFKKNVEDLGPALHLEKGEASKQALKNIKSYGYRMGLSLRKIGININFAPCVDIICKNTPHNGPIGDRAFGVEPEVATHRASYFMKGLLASKVVPCLKHFPGIGLLNEDTHTHSAIHLSSLEDIEKRDLHPYKTILHESPCIMISHAKFPSVCPLEASRSKVWLDHILKKKLNFKGLIVSDDMNMNAVSFSGVSWCEYLEESIIAGCDLILICEGIDRWHMAYDFLSQRAQKSSSLSKRIEESHRKVSQLRHNIFKAQHQ